MRRFLILTCCLLLLLGGYALLSAFWLFAPLEPEHSVTLDVTPGSSLHQVAEKLQHSGAIRSALALKLLARWRQQSDRIQAGRYAFTERSTPAAILDRLIRGDVETVSLTIPEGFALEQIIARIAASDFGHPEALRELSRDSAFIASLNVEANSLEGYLFPETYLFAPGVDERELLTMMVEEFHRQVDESLRQEAARHDLDLHQLVTLASIIEKETALVDEMPLIASVFHNRLQRNIPLQTDPTVIYGLRNFDGNLTRRHLETPSAYNTYLIRGLPPGPIASPGINALRAAAHPQDSDFLYFVSRGDGSHQFSRTLREHNTAVRRYQLRR